MSKSWQNRPYRNYDKFYEQYIVKNRSLNELSSEWDCSLSTLSKWRKRHKIPKYKPISEEQEKVITGLLMGDGCINNNLNGNPRLEVGSIEKEYLEYLNSEIFPSVGKSIVNGITPDEAASRNKESGFSPNAKAENYSQIFIWYTESNPNLKKFYKWYSDKGKTFPEKINLSPKILKHWYCGDGNLNNTNDCIRIYTSNESNNKNKINQYFQEVGFGKPRWTEHRKGHFSLCFDKETSYEMWKYMGEAPPGFEYKWPDKLA